MNFIEALKVNSFPEDIRIRNKNWDNQDEYITLNQLGKFDRVIIDKRFPYLISWVDALSNDWEIFKEKDL